MNYTAEFRGGGCLENQSKDELINRCTQLDYCPEVSEFLIDGETVEEDLDALNLRIYEEWAQGQDDSQICYLGQQDIEQDYKFNLI